MVTQLKAIVKSDCTLFLPCTEKCLNFAPLHGPLTALEPHVLRSRGPGTGRPGVGRGRDSAPASYWLWSPEFLFEASASLSVKWVLKLDFMHKALGEFSKTHENIYSASEILTVLIHSFSSCPLLSGLANKMSSHQLVLLSLSAALPTTHGHLRDGGGQYLETRPVDLTKSFNGD